MLRQAARSRGIESACLLPENLKSLEFSQGIFSAWKNQGTFNDFSNISDISRFFSVLTRESLLDLSLQRDIFLNKTIFIL